MRRGVRGAIDNGHDAEVVDKGRAVGSVVEQPDRDDATVAQRLVQQLRRRRARARVGGRGKGEGRSSSNVREALGQDPRGEVWRPGMLAPSARARASRCDELTCRVWRHVSDPWISLHELPSSISCVYPVAWHHGWLT